MNESLVQKREGQFKSKTLNSRYVRTFFAIHYLIVCFSLLGNSFASEASVTYTIQALTGLASDTPRFVKVYCHDKYAFSGEPTAFSFITQPYIPPHYNEGGKFDHNLLSSSKIKISSTLKNDL